jgi:hypothetical protein
MGLEVVPGVYRWSVNGRKVFQALREIGLPRHGRSVDEDRQYGERLFERELDFDSDRILLIMDTRLTSPARAKPIVANDRE